MNSLSSKFWELGTVDDLKKSWNKLSMVFLLWKWLELNQKRSKADKSSILDSWVLILNSVACGIKGSIHVSLHMLFARLRNESRGKISSLSDLPVLMLKALRDNWSTSLESDILLHLDSKSLDRAHTGRINIISCSKFIISCFSPSIHIFFALGKHLDESWIEV